MFSIEFKQTAAGPNNDEMKLPTEPTSRINKKILNVLVNTGCAKTSDSLVSHNANTWHIILNFNAIDQYKSGSDFE